MYSARLVPTGHQFLEHAAQHFGVHGRFRVERRRFRDGEAVAIEQAARRLAAEDAGEHLVGQIGYPLVQSRPLEQPDA